MNKTKIEYCDYTWNPLTGCLNNCGDFCYAEKIVKRYGHYGGSFKPQFHEHKLDEPSKVKKPSVIFVCDMGDVFSKGVLEKWRERVRNAALAAPQHIYLWLSKRPLYHNYNGAYEQPNWWQGVSITNDEDAYFLHDAVPIDGNTWISYEPLFGFIRRKITDTNQVIIGRATNHNSHWANAWAEELTANYKGTPVFWKDNIGSAGPKDLAWVTNK